MDRQTSSWKQWLQFGRVVPLIVMIAAGVIQLVITVQAIQDRAMPAGTITLLGILALMLGLLALDSLTERMSILQKILDRLSEFELQTTQGLKNREALNRLSSLSPNATEISVLAISGLQVIINNYEFIEDRLRNGCKLQFIFMDPESSAIHLWNEQNKPATATTDIHAAIERLQQLKKATGVDVSQCKLYLTSMLLPFSLVMVDPNKDNGMMTVEYHTYKTPVPDRPHIQLSRSTDGRWFSFYQNQFTRLWNELEKGDNPDLNG